MDNKETKENKEVQYYGSRGQQNDIQNNRTSTYDKYAENDSVVFSILENFMFRK